MLHEALAEYEFLLGHDMMLAAVVFLGVLSVQAIPQDLSSFLQSQMDFSSSDLRHLALGRVVTRKLHADTDREIALVGVTRLPTTKQRFLEEFRSTGTILQNGHTTRIRAFSPNPVPDDLVDFTMTEGDLDALRQCTAGDCDVNVSELVLSELQRLDESSDAYPDQVSTTVRTMLLDYVRRYLAEGDSALVVYNHKSQPLSLAEGFRHLLGESPYLLEYVPKLHQYLEVFPRDHLSDVEEFLYWTVEEFGMRPLTSVTHATIFDRLSGPMPRALILLKQIYASHYFHASLKVLGLVTESADPDEPGLYLIYLDRSLFDSKIGGIKRRMAERELRQNLSARLESIRRAFEEPEPEK